MVVDVIIPTYKPGAELIEIIHRLQEQDYPIHRIRIINTESEIFPEESELDQSKFVLEIMHIHPSEFDHGGTRNMGAELSDADIVVYLTQDAVPADRNLIRKFVEAFENNQEVNIAYGRQLPRRDCDVIERYTRQFNYPKQSRVKSKSDLPELGIKTFFCSDACAAYRRECLLATGGFDKGLIFNEDMIYAGRRILAGDKVAYVADATVIHSHNYNGRQQFKRNFDLAVSQAQHPEVFADVPSEGEGMKLVKNTATYLLKKGRFFSIVKLFVLSACKYAGYLLGKQYQKLPQWAIIKCTSNPHYWKFQ